MHRHRSRLCQAVLPELGPLGRNAGGLRDLGRWLRRAAGGHYGDRIGRKSTLIATLLLRGGGGHDRCVGFRLCCCRVRFTHAYRGDDARLRFETQLVGARCPFAPFPVLCTADEWNRNTPAVHRSGRSAKLPGGFVRHRRAVDPLILSPAPAGLWTAGLVLRQHNNRHLLLGPKGRARIQPRREGTLGFSSWPLGGPGWAKPCFCCPAEPRS
jgi:hypothetical protein